MAKPILVSACLAGLCTNWRGGCDTAMWIRRAVAEGRAVTACPEQMGGLPTPRVPVERRDDRVFNAAGRDVTAQMLRGAEETLAIARAHGCEVAVLSPRSPSCGVGRIYDGSFRGKMIEGDGVAAEMLREAGLQVIPADRVSCWEEIEHL